MKVTTFSPVVDVVIDLIPIDVPSWPFGTVTFLPSLKWMIVLPAASVSVRVIVIDAPFWPLSPLSPFAPFGITTVVLSENTSLRSPLGSSVLLVIVIE